MRCTRACRTRRPRSSSSTVTMASNSKPYSSIGLDAAFVLDLGAALGVLSAADGEALALDDDGSVLERLATVTIADGSAMFARVKGLRDVCERANEAADNAAPKKKKRKPKKP